eukprot:GEMP01040975.1.p1 GENE.GEMP01040975.1~~GEMP01040975.1.p1  ORF type:complete len:417 (+),score=104.85 GEMP01040975.1:516-1766(+)
MNGNSTLKNVIHDTPPSGAATSDQAPAVVSATLMRESADEQAPSTESISPSNDHPIMQITDVDALRGRILDLETAIRDLLDSNHRLRIENSDADAGLGKALELLQAQKKEQFARRKHATLCGMNLAENTRTLWAYDIPHVDADIDPAIFYRDFVSTSRPCIVRSDATKSRSRTIEWILSQCGDSMVSVNCTPNGLADAVINGVFVKPLMEKMTFSTFWQRLQGQGEKDVVYVSEQNDSLRREFPQLFQDPPILDAFDERHPLDAVNFWLGDERSYSSFHKDSYENFYSVLFGTKIFWLVPPTAAWCMHERLFPMAKWTGGPQKWKLEAEEGEVPWIPVDARQWEQSDEYHEQYPDFANAPFHRVEIAEGESLYLPSLWYHAASQRGVMAAVNYWFDMQFDCKWVYYQYLRDMNNLP